MARAFDEITTMYQQTNSNERGFTLIELMIAVAVVAILSAIALPSYNQYVLRSHRAEAKNMLLAVAQRLEQNYTLSGSYDTTPGNAAPNINNAMLGTWGLSQAPLSGAPRYNISFQAAPAQPTPITFVLLATPVGAQIADTTCGVLLLNNVNLKGAAGQNNRSQVTRDCWDR